TTDSAGFLATDPRFTSSGVNLSQASAAVTLSGAIAPNATYSLLLRTGEIGDKFSYVTGASDSTSSIAKALAAAVNVNAPDNYTAFVRGSTLFVVNRAGSSFSLANAASAPAAAQATQVQLTATELFAGEVWTVILDDATFTTTHTHVVGQGETLADVARQLANSIVASGVVTFTATT